MYCWGLGMKKSADGYSGVGNGSHHGRHHLGKRSADPYEFDEENHQAPAVNMEGLKRKDGVSVVFSTSSSEVYVYSC